MEASFIKVKDLSVTVDDEVRQFHGIGDSFLVQFFQIFFMRIQVCFRWAITQSISLVESSKRLFWDFHSVCFLDLQTPLVNTEMSPLFKTFFTKKNFLNVFISYKFYWPTRELSCFQKINHIVFASLEFYQIARYCLRQQIKLSSNLRRSCDLVLKVPYTTESTKYNVDLLLCVERSTRCME